MSSNPQRNDEALISGHSRGVPSRRIAAKRANLLGAQAADGCWRSSGVTSAVTGMAMLVHPLETGRPRRPPGVGNGPHSSMEVIDMKSAIRLALTLSVFAILHSQLASATTIKYLQLPAVPQGSTLTLPLTLNLPCYGRVQVATVPTPPTNAPGGVTFFHQTAAESQSPQNNPAISWGSDTDRFNVVSSAHINYRVTFTFLDTPPPDGRLILVVAGLATQSTATVSTSPASLPGNLLGEYTFAPTTSTTKLVGATLSSLNDFAPMNTGWALYSPNPPAPVFTSLSVDIDQQSGDGVGFTLAYICPATTNTYAAKFICGVQQDNDITHVPDAQAGRYSTKINVHNNTGAQINFRKKIIQLSGGERPIDPQIKVFENLQGDQAMEVVCRDIYQHLKIPTGKIPPYIEGFVILEVYFLLPYGRSIGPPPADPLDVVGIYTYKGDLPSTPGAGASIEVVVYPAKNNSHILD